MPRTGPPFPIHLRARIVALVREGHTPEELAEEFGPSPATIRHWVEQADRNSLPPEGGRSRPGPGKRRSDRDPSWHQS